MSVHARLAATSKADVKLAGGLRAGALLLIARVGVVLVVTVVAYQYTLSTFILGFGELAPVAYGVLVPPLALLIATVHGFERGFEPEIHDRSLDYLIGGTLLGAALVMVLILPLPLSLFFWQWRVDVISMPLFIAAAICIMFDVRALWRMRFATAFMFLAWPPLYFIVSPGAAAIVAGASGAVAHSLWPFLSQRHLVDASDLGVVATGPPVNALLLFVVVTIAAALLARGGVLGKIAWLATGLALAWGLGLTQQVLISLVTAHAGSHPSIWLTSLYAGFVPLGLALVLMVALLPIFGLRPRTMHGVRRVDVRRSLGRVGLAAVLVSIAGLTVGVGDARLALQQRSFAIVVSLGIALVVTISVLWLYGLRPRSLRRTSSVDARGSPRRFVLAAILVGAAGLFVSAGDAQLHRYEPIADALGSTRIPADTVSAFSLPGWTAQAQTHPWAAISLDKSASWTRYSYRQIAQVDGSSAGSIGAFTLDVVSTTDLTLFSTYGIEASYRLQNHPILAAEWIELGDGLTGHAVRYGLDGSGATWTGIYWQWPVRAAAGLRYERVVLSARESLAVRAPPLATDFDLVRKAQLAIANSAAYFEGRADDWTASPQLDFMVGVARAIVASAVTEVRDSSRQGGNG